MIIELNIDRLCVKVTNKRGKKRLIICDSVDKVVAKYLKLVECNIRRYKLVIDSLDM